MSPIRRAKNTPFQLPVALTSIACVVRISDTKFAAAEESNTAMGSCPSRERRKKYLAELERYQRDLEKAVAEARAAWVEENRFRRRNGLPMLPDPAESNYNLALTGPSASGAGDGSGLGGSGLGGTGVGAAAGGGLRGGQRQQQQGGVGGGAGASGLGAASDGPMRNALAGGGGIRRTGLGTSGLGASGLGSSSIGASGLGASALGASGLGGLGLSGLGGGGGGGGGNRRGDQGRMRTRCQPQKNSIHCNSALCVAAVFQRGRQIRVFSP